MTRFALLATAAAMAAAAPAAAQQHDHSQHQRTNAALTRPKPAEDAALAKVLASRSAEDRSRDAYRRPGEALTFWGLRPGMTVLEVQPGAGWWTEILAPYAKATGGKYIATGPDLGNANLPEAGKKARADLEAKLKDPRYGTTQVWNWGPQSAPPPANSVDFILVARTFHNWARQGSFTDKAMKDFATALKPGGVLAVEQHRSAEGVMKPETGYVPESYVVQAAEKAGLKLAAKSEINANAKDNRDHPFGVWTLQPVRNSEGDGRKLTAEERARYDAIGESDRMTLRFVKPA
jgi:predicted methyltransferase